LNQLPIPHGCDFPSSSEMCPPNHDSSSTGREQANGREHTRERWVESLMAFANPSYVFPDHRRGGSGNRLILPHRSASGKPLGYRDQWDLQRIRIYDLARGKGRGADHFEPDIFSNGFAIADLSFLRDLQAALYQVASQDHIGKHDVQKLTQAVTGVPIPLGAGHTLEVLGVDTSTLYMRKSGPDAMSLGVTEQSGRTLRAAVNVHTDGDVDSERHSPGWKRRFHHSGNPSSETFVLNLWIPLQQPVRPLAVMDCATLDRKRDQVQQMFTLPARKNGEALHPLAPEEVPQTPQTGENHCYLHRSSQEWYFKSDMGPGQALVFDTMSTPHGTFLLPGETELGQLFRQLQRAVAVLTEQGPHEAVSIGALNFALWPDAQEPSSLCPEPEAAPVETLRTLPLRRLTEEMDGLVREGRTRLAELCRASTTTEREAGIMTHRMDYLARVSTALGRSARKSVEIRCSAIVRRRGWSAGGNPLDAISSQLQLRPVLDRLGFSAGLWLLVRSWVASATLYLFGVGIILLSFRWLDMVLAA